ncbi:MAG: KilA-N domain-containing protein [Bacilli bacterium]
MNDNVITKMHVKDNLVKVMRVNGVDYISLTDLASYINPNDPSGVIRNWMSTRNSFSFYSLWEELNNPDFNSVKSHGIKIDEVPYNRFTMTPNRWKKEFNAIGIIPSSGKYSKGTFAHPDIALEFASWIDPAFKLYLIKEFERLKHNETYQERIEWSVRRSLSKTNYRIHTDSIKENIVPTLTDKQKLFIYANEADVINVALFGMTAKEWRENNPDKEGNIRDYTDILHLVVLSNLEVLNVSMIENNISQKDRLEQLNKTARRQINILANDGNIVGITKLDDTKMIE